MTRKMKDSGVEWIGEIPEGWELGRTWQAFKVNKVIAGDQADKFPRLSLSNAGVIERDKYDGKGESPADYGTYQIIPKHQFVFNFMGLEQDAIYRRVGIAPITGLVSAGYMEAEYSAERVDPLYGYYLFRYMENDQIFKQYGTGIRSNLNKKQFLNIPFLYPALNEQKEIARLLDDKVKKIDDIIAETQQSIEELKKYKQALITEVVTKGLDANVEMKDSGIEWIGTIPVSTKLRKIKTFLKVKNGKEIKEDTGEISVYGSGGAFKKTNEIIYDRASVLFGRKGTIGKPLLVKEPFWTVDTMFYTQIMETLVELKWVYYLFTVLPWEYHTTQTALPSIVGTDVENIKVPYVSLRNQKKIVDYLDKKTDQIDSLIMTKQQVVFEYQKYKNMIIYEYVTGKRYIK
ncbi:restriction endonuclease subunit S [Enterococcus casseliflavus]|uniref:restriction endonuclease subunit S n=1 Tax=Enterococcus casseliflavus TaxID=37734 RepID=UPI0032E3FB87